MEYKFYKVSEVESIGGFNLKVKFENGITKRYDVNPLFNKWKIFNELKNNGLVPNAGDILVTSRGTLGRCYIVKECDEFYFQDGMISWLSNLDSQLTNMYLSHLFMTSGIQKQIESLQAGSTVTYLSIAMLKILNIILPPLDLQNQFADFVAQVDKSKLVAQRGLQQLKFLLSVKRDGLLTHVKGACTWIQGLNRRSCRKFVSWQRGMR